MDAIEALKTRRSVRTYRRDPVPREVVEDIVDCARLAASAINVQPWEFVAVTDGDTRREIAAATDYGPFIAEAPVCVAVLSQGTKYYLEDGSAATQNLLVAARAHGLGSCWVAGDKKPYAGEVLRILNAPSDLKLVSLVALGYADAPAAPDKRPLKDVLHWEQF
jgi:nitroreductase